MKNLGKISPAALVLACALAATTALSLPSQGKAQPPEAADSESEDLLFRFRQRTIRGSRFGPIARFQAALSDKLTACGQPGVTSDGLFGPGTGGAIVRLGQCPGFTSLARPDSDPLQGTIHSGVWRALLRDEAVPDVKERAFAITLTFEATDYDRAEWNIGTSDEASVLTWGPYGATVGHGGEVQAVLRRVQQASPGLLEEAFGGQLSTVQRLLGLSGAQALNLLRPVHTDRQRRAAWVQAFSQLGSRPEVRAAYEAHAFETNDWLRPQMRLLYRLIPEAPSRATEIDYALFLDLATHMSISQGRIDRAAGAIAAREASLGRALTPAERRQALGESLANEISSTEFRRHRRGRNVTYYIDDVSTLSPAERSDWQQISRLRVADFGLSDERTFFPDFLR